MAQDTTSPFDCLPEAERALIWEIYMDMEKSMLVETLLASLTKEELEQFLQEIREDE